MGIRYGFHCGRDVGANCGKPGEIKYEVTRVRKFKAECRVEKFAKNTKGSQNQQTLVTIMRTLTNNFNNML